MNDFLKTGISSSDQPLSQFLRLAGVCKINGVNGVS
jgi:hypothetical protein